MLPLIGVPRLLVTFANAGVSLHGHSRAAIWRAHRWVNHFQLCSGTAALLGWLRHNLFVNQDQSSNRQPLESHPFDNDGNDLIARLNWVGGALLVAAISLIVGGVAYANFFTGASRWDFVRIAARTVSPWAALLTLAAALAFAATFSGHR